MTMNLVIWLTQILGLKIVHCKEEGVEIYVMQRKRQEGKDKSLSLLQVYGYRFGRPQVDVCSQCEDLNTKMRSSLNDNANLAAAAEMLVHKRRANKF
ncbi:hypothetical protein J6590_022679 [Homalodisca vitripennis]|nr:hypothetical protein J6590_022679 [Homalodisca vitripennis]